MFWEEPKNSNPLIGLASMTPLCALFGALAISIPMQLYGRRKALMGLCIPFIIGFQLMGFTYFGNHKAMLFVGRIMTGIMNGAATPASQIYVSCSIFTASTPSVMALCD